MSSPLALYARWLEDPQAPATVRFADGSARDALVRRWAQPAGAVDERVLHGMAGPVLDVGCGPGRLLHALAHRGVFALGVDLSPVAVRLARGGGARAIVGSIFDDVPGTGTWASALLLDGNIGIGGSPQRLLERVRGLLAADGRLLVEVDGPDRASLCTRVRLERETLCSEWFPWAELSVDDAPRVLAAAGLRIVRRWSDEGRWFVLAAPR